MLGLYRAMCGAGTVGGRRQANARAELPALRAYLVGHLGDYSAEQLARINKRIVKHGGEPVVPEQSTA